MQWNHNCHSNKMGVDLPHSCKFRVPCCLISAIHTAGKYMSTQKQGSFKEDKQSHDACDETHHAGTCRLVPTREETRGWDI